MLVMTRNICLDLDSVPVACSSPSLYIIALMRDKVITICHASTGKEIILTHGGHSIPQGSYAMKTNEAWRVA